MEILRRICQNKLEVLVTLVILFQFSFPNYGIAAELEEKPSILLPNLVVRETDNLEADGGMVSLIMPVRAELKVVQTYQLTVTAYSSTVDQTDNTPCITANSFDLCANNQEDVVAANFLPFGTRIRIPEYFGERIFSVQDRMNARYYYQVDIWMKSREAAKKFGAQYTKIEVLE